MKTDEIIGFLLALGLVILSIAAPRLSIAVYFIGFVVRGVYTSGFPEGLIGGAAIGGLFSFISWLRFRKSSIETTRAREQLKGKLSKGKCSACEVCGSKKLTYHRTPKNIGQLLLGGLTCENCGAEISVPFDLFIPR